ncbi:hypothetical protein [Streptomyces sp. MMG1522]|uniref:hypothetical protein n=1 Tax=Streptomyces sp. MMG1522 TaxID=1415545 RepID=UPI0006AECA95|nr:hypothetical protein [Streptomyces sp. MMG1522]
MTAPPEPRTHSIPGIVLPAAFRAFHTLQEPAYRLYTEAHTTPADSGPLLGRAFGELAAHWSQIMLCPDPAAYAWDLLTTTVHTSAGRFDIPATSRLQYEAVLLHHIAGCTIHRTSETTGRPPEKIRHLLRTWPGIPPGAVAPDGVRRLPREEHAGRALAPRTGDPLPRPALRPGRSRAGEYKWSCAP